MIATIYHNDRAVTLSVSGRRDIEELLARCGFIILNDALTTIDDRRHIDDIHAQGYAKSMGLSSDAALAWWHAHTINIKV